MTGNDAEWLSESTGHSEWVDGIEEGLKGSQNGAQRAAEGIGRMLAVFVIAMTWNEYPGEGVRYITSGNTYPPPVARFDWYEANETVESMRANPANAHLSFEMVLATAPNGDYAFHRRTMSRDGTTAPQACYRATHAGDCPENHLYGRTAETAI